MDTPLTSSAKKPAPRTHRKHRQASDAKWRANMYICFNLLRHSCSKPDLTQINTKCGKITRVGALKQTLTQLPASQDVLFKLLEEKKRRAGITEDLFAQSMQEFQHLTEQVRRYQMETRRARNNTCGHSDIKKPKKKIVFSGNDDHCSKSSPSRTSPSGTSISSIPSLFSDISSAIDEEDSEPCSPSRLTICSSPDEYDDLPFSQLHSSYFEYMSECTDDTLKAPNSDFMLDGIDLIPSVSNQSLDVEEFVDLETLTALMKSPSSKSPVTGICADTPFQTPKARARSPEDVLLITESKCRNLDFSSLYQDAGTTAEIKRKRLACDKRTMLENIDPPNFDSISVDEDASLRMYDSGDESVDDGKLLSGQSDPMMSAAHRRSVARLRGLMAKAQPKKEIISPWKMEDIHLEYFHKLEN